MGGKPILDREQRDLVDDAFNRFRIYRESKGRARRVWRESYNRIVAEHVGPTRRALAESVFRAIEAGVPKATLTRMAFDSSSPNLVYELIKEFDRPDLVGGPNRFRIERNRRDEAASHDEEVF